MIFQNYLVVLEKTSFEEGREEGRVTIGKKRDLFEGGERGEKKYGVEFIFD